MHTDHAVHVGDARSLGPVADDAVDLVVTSPPYPMIELWDESFGAQDERIATALSEGDGDRAFALMHELLDEVWGELARVVRPGGIVCVNVGDATRTVDGEFAQYPNHARIVSAFRELGFSALPDVLWRKPTNKAAKFMGSGMLPTNAYVTLEHEYVLVFRNGGPRSFEPGSDERYESAYFWEERNEWFSDVWTEISGRLQESADGTDRERTGAFPFEIPYRLVCMYSTYGDTVLDPFWGTGTTTLAAMAAARNSVGVERDPDFVEGFDERVADLPERSERVNVARLDRHRAFVDERVAEGDPPSYEAEHYDTRVVTKQERRLRLYDAVETERVDDAGADAQVRVEHAPHEDG